jgi:hypothetical protein
VLARHADPSGLLFYSTSVAGGKMTLQAIAGAFFDSPEFNGRFSPGSMSNSAFVTFLYNLLFLRDPDPSGFQTYTAYLDAGNSRRSLFDILAGSEEFRSKNPLLAKAPPSLPNSEAFLQATFAGYQGWFATAGDGALNGWMHWSRGTKPSKGNVTFELYPDLRDFPAGALFDTALAPFPDGSPARLYSASKLEAADLHFKWMRDYGIDGAALQRFIAAIGSEAVKKHFNQVALNVRSSAEKYGRRFYAEYDLSGCRDWDSCVRDRMAKDLPWVKSNLVASSAYARASDGRPVIGIWGIGFNDRDLGDAAKFLSLFNSLKEAGFFVLGGVPYGWRTGDADSKPGFLPAYLYLDAIQPWMVGRFNDDGVASDAGGRLAEDMAYAKSMGVGYQRVLWPGFAWSNWNGGPRNSIPRKGGDFFWRQAFYARQAGASAMVAMFDEFDEGTAVAKAAESANRIPSDQYFLTLDADGLALPSDHYLFLAGRAAAMFRGELPLASNKPSRANGARFVSQSVPAAMTAGGTYAVSVTMRNSGTTVWTRAYQHKLGTQNPQDNGLWTGGTRVYLGPEESVAPGQEKTFSFGVKAPSAPGSYSFQWRMVQDGVEWFGDMTPNVSISVQSPLRKSAGIAKCRRRGRPHA